MLRRVLIVFSVLLAISNACPAQPPPSPRRTQALEGNWTCYYSSSASRAIELYCGPNEDLYSYGFANCQPYCGQIDPFRGCRNITVPRCYCAKGFVREGRSSLSACVAPRNCKRAILYG